MLERVLEFSLKQRFLVIIATALVVVLGLVSWQQLTLDAVPDITTNQVAINTETGGMSPEEVEKLVTFPIETSMGGIPGVEQVRSLSQYGLSQVIVTFRDEVDTYFARNLVNERLNSVKESLPSGIEAPQMGPVSTGLGDIYMYALESEKRSPMELRSLQDWTIAPQLRTVAGVAEVNSADGSVKQYQVVVEPRALLARGIAVDEVVTALQKNNQNAGGGVLERNGERVLIRSVGLATTISDIEKIVVKTESGIPVLVRDVAKVQLGIPVLTGISTKDGKEAMTVTVMMLKGANGRTVANAVDAKVKEIKSQLPEDVTLTTVYNRSDLVGESVLTVEKSLLEGGVLVIVVLLLLLGNFRGALIVALAIPLSMLFAIIGMNRFGISGNLMSLGAIDFGLIVDGAVVMIENAVRRLAEAREHKGSKLDRHEVRHSVWESCREVAKPTAFAVTIITVVYLPILALEGTEGKMFKPMAFTVVFALIGALILTMTLIPVLASMFLSGDTKEGRNPVMEFFSRVYAPVLRFALKRRAVVVGGAVAILLLAGFLFSRLGSEFIPQLDEGSLVIQPVRVRTVDAEQTVRLVTAFEKKVLEVPEVTTVFSRSGTPEVATDPMPLSLTDSFIMLKPRDKWRAGMTKEKLIEELTEKVNQVPGQGYNFSQPIQMRFSELVSGVKADIGIKVFGEDLSELKAKADEIAAAVRDISGAQDVEVEQVDEVPVLQIDIDRDAISRVGVSIDDIQEMIKVALGGEPVGQIIEGDKRFALTVKLPDSIRNDVEAIKSILIETPEGGGVPLSSLAHIDDAPAPAQISREMGKRRVVVQMNVRGSDIGTFVAAAQKAIKEKVKLKEGYYITWGGQFENLQKASARLMLVVPLALSLIFLLLFSTFGSLKQAILIFTGVPLAITGGIVGLFLRGMPFSITAGVGFIALSGVAVLNGVVMVSAINRLRDDGKLGVIDAVREGATQRLRPVLMTALVAALGFIPMALNTGIGAEVQRPLATVVIGGIASATLLTLVVLPALYTWFESDKPTPTEL
ncbi:MAG: efflux RND transporter permease subunit [Armatimonadetes bacterium]|jgi:cobalt-zinc-cadmium resistance protein CzcA|nr:efflux RND transporter permease subunit [Armatimonadota bacterium]MBX3110189.1 efflux RND transporter permease subunit [Fimbriimonadaceae bacterium]MBX3114581.1 efflux RND transporter permease subunit [Fimbriimonadaceae bacterium]